MLDHGDGEDDIEARLDAVDAAAGQSWRRLQDLIWGPRWDFSLPCLDFSEASLYTLARWLKLAASEQTIEAFGDTLRCAGFYFGQTVKEQVQSFWELRSDGMIGLRVRRRADGGGDREVDIVDVLQSWYDALQRDDGTDEGVLVEQWRLATLDGDRHG